MALISCPDCGHPVAPPERSGVAALLPVTQAQAVTAVGRQVALLEVRPSWWHFIWHLLLFSLVGSLLITFVPHSWWSLGWLLLLVWPVGLLLVALYRRYSFVMRIYSDRVSVEEGFFAKETSEFFIKDIRSIDVRQGLWGRLVGIGDITISTAATIEAAEEARGVPQPNRIKDLLIAQRQQSTS